jgi:hypothetical protein
MDGKEVLEMLWGLLFQPATDLPSEKIEQILQNREPLQKLLDRKRHYFPNGYETVLRYRRRKPELEKLPTKLLERMRKSVIDHRIAIMNSVPDEELSDSFFEPPSFDEDESIVYEILEERTKNGYVEKENIILDESQSAWIELTREGEMIALNFFSPKTDLPKARLSFSSAKEIFLESKEDALKEGETIPCRLAIAPNVFVFYFYKTKPSVMIGVERGEFEEVIKKLCA